MHMEEELDDKRFIIKKKQKKIIHLTLICTGMLILNRSLEIKNNLKDLN